MRAVAAAAVFLALCGGLYGYAVWQWRGALADLASGRPADARDRLITCRAVWRWSPEVELAAARAARAAADFGSAEDHLNRCLKLAGGATDAIQLEFLLLRAQSGEVDDVIDPLIRAVELGHGQSAEVMFTLARVYMTRTRYTLAYACLSKLIELDPGSAKAYHWRGWVAERLNQSELAATDYRKAVDLDPSILVVRLRLVEMLLEDKRVPEATPLIERLHQEWPDRPEVSGRLGMCRLMQGDLTEARRLLESAAAGVPDDTALLLSLAKLDLQEGRGADAERRLREVARLDPTDTEARYNLAAAIRLQGRAADAEAAMREYERYKAVVDRANRLLREVVDTTAGTAADRAEVGRLLMQVGREKLGLYWLHEALAADPNQQQAHAALADHYTARGEAAQAAQHRARLRPPADSVAP